jgi:hypothetical protein
VAQNETGKAVEYLDDLSVHDSPPSSVAFTRTNGLLNNEWMNENAT